MSKTCLPDILTDDRKDEINGTFVCEQSSEQRGGKQQASLAVKTLEPRILLSATWVDADPQEEIEESSFDDQGFVEDQAGLADELSGGGDDLFADETDDGLLASESEDALSATAEEGDPLNVVLIDSTLEDADVLADAVDEDAIVILYDGADGTIVDVLAQVEGMSDATGSEIASLSILSHGSGGQFDLGDEVVSVEMTTDQFAAWESLSDNFTDDANIYVYGCDVVDGSGAGQELLNALSEVTDTEVFGSNDLTGAGGDWDLEAVSAGGEGELAEGFDTPFDATMAVNYAGTLAEITGTESDDSLDGTNQSDTMIGLGGSDTLKASNGNDTLYGGAGDDTLYGENNDDTLYGGEGDDTLYGGNNNDTLDGGTGKRYALRRKRH